MSSGSIERQTINLPGTTDQPKTEPDYFLDPRSAAALSQLQDGDLLKMVAPEDLAEYFDAPGIKKFAFYRYPGSGAVILIWTRFPATASTKNARVQHRLRRDLTWHAEKADIKNVATVSLGLLVVNLANDLQLEVQSRKDITAERLREAADALTISKE
ncbi:hypothetical protein BFJ68_g9093 [Fusarium oxysporum]|uniref:Uncharacterized protein n=1 Tax=Fusarium oxysporum TaxID=5507 RepID=A0A420QWM5_FUSOX|nr:hypothetical protein BFJ68_g9093 [Fusarium oxysporum]